MIQLGKWEKENWVSYVQSAGWEPTCVCVCVQMCVFAILEQYSPKPDMTASYCDF